MCPLQNLSHPDLPSPPGPAAAAVAPTVRAPHQAPWQGGPRTTDMQYAMSNIHNIDIINIMAAWAVDREFADIVGPGRAPFGRLGPPLGPHRDAFGSTLVSLWSPWDTSGVHVERLGFQGAILKSD